MAGFDNDVVYALNADFTSTDNQTPSAANGLATNGQMWIGSTALNAGSTHINVGSITSPDSSVTVSYSSPNITLVVNGSAVGKTITGNSGGALSPTAGNWNIITANSTPIFAGSGSTLTLDFGLNNLILGNSITALTSGTLNVALGNRALMSVNSGGGNVAIGYNAGQALTTGQNNVFVGLNCATSLTTSPNSTAVGTGALALATTGTGLNVAMGYTTLGNITTGHANVAVGATSGTAYTSSESSNICISNLGVLGESNVIRIGTQGTSDFQQNQCYLAGVLNTVSGRVVKITAPGAYPYTTLITDYVIIVDSSSARTINLIASPVTGTTYRIKDNAGLAGTNTITVSGNGKNIDGSTPYLLTTNYESIDVTYNGTQWNIL